MVRAHDEIVDFIVNTSSPEKVVAFRPSEATDDRVSELLRLSRSGDISPDEKSELDHFLEYEHLMRMAKAKARSLIANRSARS